MSSDESDKIGDLFSSKSQQQKEMQAGPSEIFHNVLGFPSFSEVQSLKSCTQTSPVSQDLDFSRFISPGPVSVGAFDHSKFPDVLSDRTVKEYTKMMHEKNTSKAGRYDTFACCLMTQMIQNMRAKEVEDSNSRVILLRRGQAIGDAHEDRQAREADERDKQDLVTLPSSERTPKLTRGIDTPLSNDGTKFSIQLGHSMLHELPTMMFVAPHLATVETGKRLAQSMPVGVEFKIEPGLASFYPANTETPKFTYSLANTTVMTIRAINNLLGKETYEAFEGRVKRVVSKLLFCESQSTIILAECDVIDAIIATHIRKRRFLSKKQRESVRARIPFLSMMHFDVSKKGDWKMSAASLPGSTSTDPSVNVEPDIDFLCRPTDF